MNTFFSSSTIQTIIHHWFEKIVASISLAVGGLIGMAAYRSNQLHIKYNELKAEVNAAQTVEEVEAITWDD